MKNITTIEQLAVKHDYYCSDSNYFSRETQSTYKTFNDFYKEWFEADVDMNLCFRWDIGREGEEKDENKLYYMQIFLIQQRKGKFYPIWIDEVVDSDVQHILEYLKKHQKTLRQIWKPL